MKMTQLSVSSAILAAVLSGCSQQQVIGGSQVAGGSQMMGSQQQVETATPVVVPRVLQPRVVTTPRKVMKAQKRIVRKAPPKPRHVVKRKSNNLPSAKPGQCFAKVKVPATFKTQSRRILIKKAASKRVLVRAPQYRWINKKVLVRKAIYRSRVQPAQYRTTVKRVIVKPAYNTWRKGHGAITRIDNMTGEIMCRVTVPAVYKNVSRRALVRPARTIRTLVPAVYKTVKQKQRVAPALYKTVHTPARYKTQNYRVKVGGARYVWRSILCKTNAPKNYRKAAVKGKKVVRSSYKKQYRSQGISYSNYLKVMNAGPKTTSSKKRKAKKVVEKKAVEKKAVEKKAVEKKAVEKKAVEKKVVQKESKKAEMKKVVPAKTQQKSKAQAKKGIVFNIQNALKDKGFNPGAIDGKMGPGTAAALKAFQKSHGLPVGQLSKDTFRALGLIR